MQLANRCVRSVQHVMQFNVWFMTETLPTVLEIVMSAFVTSIIS